MDLALEEQLRRTRGFTIELASKLSLRKQQEMAAWFSSLDRPVTDVLAGEIQGLADAEVQDQ